MSSGKVIRAADLFCGAGGSSSGLVQAVDAAGIGLELLAVNHWDVAIATHTLNHPRAAHRCENIEALDPRKAVPGGRLQLLLASPECVHHSNARGGMPMSDQSRASAWHILRWAEALYIETILIENVREFRDWGPLGANGRPLKGKRGVLYREFLRSLRALGYVVDDRILCAADYGDATTRQRLFIQARRGGRKIIWPAPTHSPANRLALYGTAQPWRPAREIIDWSVQGRSIYGRKKPLSPNTMRRILAGLRKYSGLPFLIGQQSCAAPRGVTDPVPTVASAGAISLVQPYLVVLRNNQGARSLDEPTPAITCSGAHLALCEPFLVGAGGPSGQGEPRSVGEQLGTVLTADHRALVEPYVVAMEHATEDRTYPVDEPLRTVTAKGQFALASPYVVRYNGSHAGRSDGDGRTQAVDAPLSTLDTSNRLAVAEPYVVPFYGEHSGQTPRTASVDEPLDTVTCQGRLGLARPYLIKYHGSDNGAHTLEEPIDTISTRDRYALVSPELRASVPDGDIVGWLDIRFRMLQPHELAAAMGFPADYKFTGNREQTVRQIGNAVCVNLARALCSAVLGIEAQAAVEAVAA